MKNLFCYCISVGPVTYENPPISEKTIQAISINNEMPKHILEVAVLFTRKAFLEIIKAGIVSMYENTT